MRYPIAALIVLLIPVFNACAAEQPAEFSAPDWPQWRGPARDGQATGAKWPEHLNEQTLKKVWRVELGSSYSGPLIVGDVIFTTETKDAKTEAAIALDRKTGKQIWRTEWQDSMVVPFYAMANGSWIRATPAYDGERLYVAGMRDLLLCLDGKTGKELWRVDFVALMKSPEPAFGFVSSPLVDGDAVYVQAGASTVKVNKKSGEILWRTLKDEGGEEGSAFASPMIAELAGQRQLIVQTRRELNGVDLETGKVFWTQPVPNFRGMNVLTPLILGDSIFTSTYRNGAYLYKISREGQTWKVTQAWTNNAQGNISSPIAIDGFAYLYLQAERFACIDLKTGERPWTSDRFGKYWSVIAQNDRILALDANGTLRLIKANAKQFELIDTLKIADAETWAHLAVSGEDVVIREQKALVVYRWGQSK
jgi:outer membrane protein assembly factor BamB